MTTATTTRRTTVLLVEDNPGDARLILEMLKDPLSESFELERVTRLDAALERLKVAAVDVVLLDLGLPDSEGLDTYSRVQREMPEEPIVVISGLNDERVALEAVRAGAQDYLVKGQIEGALLSRVLRYAIQRKQADQTLRASEARLRAIVSGALDAHITMDESGAIAGWNPQAEATFGWRAIEVMGLQLADVLLPPAYREAHRVGLAHFLATREGAILNRRLELRALHRDGREFPVELSVAPIRLGNAWLFSAFVRDITERQQAVRDLASTAARLRGLMDNANDGVSVLSREGVILDANRRFAEIAGRPLDQVIGHHIADFSSDPAYVARIPDFGATVAAGGGHVLGIEFPRPDGTVAIVDFSIALVNLETEQLVFSIGRDVTQHRQLENQYRQAQKMEAVGRLAGGVAHDFNNVLTAIVGYSEILLEGLPQGDAHRDDVAEIRTAAQRAAGLTRQLLAFSRQQVLQPTVLSVNDVVENLEKMLRRLIGADVDLATVRAPDAGNVLADPGQLEQVVLNLTVNARDAMPRGGKLTIETATAELSDEYADAHQSVISGDYVLIAVSDTGMGMTPEVRARIFEPFFTTKEKGKGTGLGLSTVYGIVKQSGGYVWVYSEPGLGTTFKVYLPRVDTPVAVPSAPKERAGPTRGTETILLAEDDELLRPLVRGLLEKLGYTVLTTSNAEEAMTRAREYSGTIHLLLTDVVMPGESGRELARHLAEERPETLVLYMSGYTDDAIVHHGLLEPGLQYLPKPFTPAVLARRVRDLLDAR